MKTVYVRTKTKDEARKRAEWLYMILRDYTPVIADLHTSKAQVVTESICVQHGRGDAFQNIIQFRRNHRTTSAADFERHGCRCIRITGVHE